MHITPVGINSKANSTQTAFRANNSLSDTIGKIKENDTAKKVIIGTGVAASIVSLAVLAKKGKLGDAAKQFMDKIFKPRNLDEIKELKTNKTLKNGWNMVKLENAEGIKGKTVVEMFDGDKLQYSYKRTPGENNSVTEINNYFKNKNVVIKNNPHPKGDRHLSINSHPLDWSSKGSFESVRYGKDETGKVKVFHRTSAGSRD